MVIENPSGKESALCAVAIMRKLQIWTKVTLSMLIWKEFRLD